MTADFLRQMNAVYEELEQKAWRVRKMLHEKGLEFEYGWFNAHYRRNTEGEWQRDAYPIPVIGVKGLCDIEMQFNSISVSAKMKKEAALAFDYEILAGYVFEVFGVEDYLCDFYLPGQSMKEMKVHIAASNETDIGFAFTVAENELMNLVDFLRQQGFYY